MRNGSEQPEALLVMIFCFLLWFFVMIFYLKHYLWWFSWSTACDDFLRFESNLCFIDDKEKSFIFFHSVSTGPVCVFAEMEKAVVCFSKVRAFKILVHFDPYDNDKDTLVQCFFVSVKLSLLDSFQKKSRNCSIRKNRLFLLMGLPFLKTLRKSSSYGKDIDMLV